MSMGGNGDSKVLVALLLIALMGGTRTWALPICNIESTQIELCRPAITGMYPLPPTRQCCNLVCQANLPCLCGLKSALPAFGIDPNQALALPQKCGLTTPPACVWP
ncbi:putative lipid-transfer protein DIR1 [Tripterygium wilfordii]|uniref:putative lipid-transfer protein DIR1 n=1 Tax=Tripterygium wilfordii TaxID=458696 RepID=UPI0018F8249B|nr:putative lipid-transfer protein DIR1 [Tripterygium wilfordii]